MPKEEIFVAEASPLNEDETKVFAVSQRDVGVYRVNGQLYAYENHCAHQGGPACEGMMMPKVEEVLGEHKTFQMQRFNYEEWHIVCPWHGFEYDIKTGAHPGRPAARLIRVAVEEAADGVYVNV